MVDQRTAFEATRAEFTLELLDLLKNSAKPVTLALVFSGRQNSLTVELLVILQRSLEALLERNYLAKPRPETVAATLTAVLLCSLPIFHPELLKCIATQCGSPLEANLTSGSEPGTRTIVGIICSLRQDSNYSIISAALDSTRIV